MGGLQKEKVPGTEPGTFLRGMRKQAINSRASADSQE
jgi:hypothetical protein